MAECLTEPFQLNNIDLNSIPVSALKNSTRLKLSRTLDRPHYVLRNTKGQPRDYRGLAELMGFHNSDIHNFDRSGEPTSNILSRWEVNTSNTIGGLLNILENLERFDLIDDLRDELYITRDVQAYLEEEERKKQEPIQSPPEQPLVGENLDDIARKWKPFYHAYVCYAQADFEFVKKLMDRLEVEKNFDLFIRERDLSLGVMEYDAFFRLVQNRCGKVLVLLSPDFLNTPECNFQARYAATLGIEKQLIKIIPIILKPCELPSLIQGLCKVDLTGTEPINLAWNWSRIEKSLETDRSPSKSNGASNYPTSNALEAPTPTPTRAIEEVNYPSLPSLEEENQTEPRETKKKKKGILGKISSLF